ncbi:MAG: hypothetical protein RLZZ111_33 [Planctomycetota bacterium]|jgi:hypothetical protein
MLAWLWGGILASLGCGEAAAQEPLPQPAPTAVPEPVGAPAPAPPLPVVGEPPPMYIADPQGAGGFVGIPVGTAAEILPDWPRWFAGASGLVMTRTLPSGAATMQPLGGTQLSTADADATWSGGVDLHVGRWFGPRQKHAVEFIYWGVYGIGTSATVTASPPAIDAIPQAPGVVVAGTPASAYLSGAGGQTIARSDLVNDVEINWLYSLWERPEFLSRDPAAPSRRVNLMWLAGFRFFQVEDVLTLTSFPGGGAPGQLDLGVATNNNLYGAQVGAKFDWRFLPPLRFTAVPKFMIAGNSITNTTTLENAAGTAATFASGAPVSVHSTLGVFSWLGSVDTGLAWDVTERWTLSMGYRVVGVGNIAQADGQWPTLITNASSLPGLTAGSSTIIHGGFAGFEGRW